VGKSKTGPKSGHNPLALVSTDGYYVDMNCKFIVSAGTPEKGICTHKDAKSVINASLFRHKITTFVPGKKEKITENTKRRKNEKTNRACQPGQHTFLTPDPMTGED
jgi:hypothetical protein